MKVKLLIIFVSAAAMFWAGSYYVSMRIGERARIQEEHSRLREETRQQFFTAQAELWRKMKAARTTKDWERLVPFGVAVKDPDLQNIIAAKLFEGKFWNAEMLLSRARSLLEVDPKSRVAQTYLRQVKDIYAETEKMVPAVVERPDDPSWNARLNYVKGVYYFRLLLFADPQKDKARAVDLVSRSAQHLKTVFGFVPKEWNTEVALEILQKKAQSMSSDDKDFQRTLQLLPRRPETGPFGLGPVPEGRH